MLTRRCTLGPYVKMVTWLLGPERKQHTKQRRRDVPEEIQHLAGYGVLVGEPLFARQVFINCWNDLQYVVM